MDEDLKARLLKARVPEGTVELDGIGTVRVRGLSRGEVFAAQKTTKEGDVAAVECRYVTIGMLDPKLTEAEVRQWQENSPAGEMETVVDKIKDLSGLGEKSAKEAVASFRDEPGSGVRDVPGAEAGNDGGPAAGADEQ